MSLISGIVHQITDGTVRTGRSMGKAYKNIILTTGNKLTAFDVSFVADVEVGKEYTFPIEQSGTYINIVGAVTPVIQQEEAVFPVAMSPVVTPAEEVLPKAHTPADERGFKNRISALASAVEFLVGAVGGQKDGGFSVGNVIQTAEEFLKFINNE